jgi:hypothetical protein
LLLISVLNRLGAKVSEMNDDWKAYLDLPSPEHRRHIRLFSGLHDMTDAEDVALRGFIAWKRWQHAQMSGQASRTDAP